MKRFMVFCGYEYYPGGGFRDYVGSADTIAECLDMIIGSKNKNSTEWSDIVDSTTMKIVLPFDYTTVEDN